jgi:hypothetical protein
VDGGEIIQKFVELNDLIDHLRFKLKRHFHEKKLWLGTAYMAQAYPRAF